MKPIRSRFSRAQILSYVEYEDYSGSTPNNSNSFEMEMQLKVDKAAEDIDTNDKNLKTIEETQDSNSNGVIQSKSTEDEAVK